MTQLWIFGMVILIVVLVIMLFSHSQSMQRFAVLELCLAVIAAVAVAVGYGMAKQAMTEQYLSLFGVYISEVQDYAAELEQLSAEADDAVWQEAGDQLQRLLEQSLPVTTMDGEELRYLTAGIYERLGAGQYEVKVLRSTREGFLSVEGCAACVERLAERAIRSKTPVQERASEDTGVLVYTSSAEVMPRYVLLTEVSLAPMQAELAKLQKAYLAAAAALLAAGTLLLAAVVSAQGRQLRRLAAATARVADGRENWETLKDSAGSFWIESNEMRTLRSSLGQIFTDVERMQHDQYRILKQYYRFAPKQLEQILGKYSIHDVEPGDRARVTGTLAFLSYPGNGKTGAEYLHRMGEEYRRLGEKQRECGGVLLSDNSDLTTLRLLFRKEAKQALQFGLEMAAAGEEKREQPFVLLHHTSFTYGVVGDEEQAFTYVLSGDMEILESYADSLRAIGVRMVATDTVYEQIEKETAGRYIGYLERAGICFKLYELLDAYPAKERKRRLDTRDKFKKALNLFCQGDYYLGRNLFTEVLKECPEDEVAKWYVFLCEKYLNTDYGKGNSYSLFPE